MGDNDVKGGGVEMEGSGAYVKVEKFISHQQIL